MFTTILLWLILTLCIATSISAIVGGLYLIVTCLAGNGGKFAGDIWMDLVLGVLTLAFGIMLALAVAAWVTGEIGESLPDGCYVVTHHLQAMPAGKTIILYNDHDFTPIECP